MNGKNGKYIDSILPPERPSGGHFNEECKNSALFTDRVCKIDGKPYEDGVLCPCFTESEEKLMARSVKPNSKTSKGKRGY